MGDMMEREKLLDEIFLQYDVYRKGELDTTQLQQIHGDMRLGTISTPQIEESIKYVCVDECCERSELFDLLQEMDRRHFLIQNLRWEFSLLDTERTNTITEEKAKWFVEMTHGEFFSDLRWERFLRSRAIPGSGVSFSEIEVMLCNIPSREDWLADQEEMRHEQEENDRQRQELNKMVEAEKQKKRRQWDEERKTRENNDMKNKLDEDRRNREDEDERHQQRKDKEEAAKRKMKLEDEEERGRKEAEERERKNREKKDAEEHSRAQKEDEELDRLRRLEAEHRLEEEARRRQELREASDFEAVLKEVTAKEQEAEAEATRHHEHGVAAGDDQMKRHAAEAEEMSRLKQKEYSNKRIRYNLKVAIKRRDKVRLHKAMGDFKKAKLPDDDQDLPKAEKILKEIQARDGLTTAMTVRNLKQLEQAISYVKRNGFEIQLQHELIEAQKVLLQLRRLERIRAEILELKQATVAEIRSYQKPPPVVHIVMTGTFLILGHKEKETKDWKNVQALVGKTGKEGLKRRCLGCEPIKIPPEAAQRAKQLIVSYQLDEVRDVSAGAATFYLWSWTMIEEAEAQRAAQKQEEEERKRLQEEKRQKRKDNPDAVFSDDEDVKSVKSATKKQKAPQSGAKKRESTPAGRSRSKTPVRTPSDSRRSQSLDSKSVERGRKASADAGKKSNKTKSVAGTPEKKKAGSHMAEPAGGSTMSSGGDVSDVPPVEGNDGEAVTNYSNTSAEAATQNV